MLILLLRTHTVITIKDAEHNDVSFSSTEVSFTISNEVSLLHVQWSSVNYNYISHSGSASNRTSCKICSQKESRLLSLFEIADACCAVFFLTQTTEI
jgi:hypothetical protein